MKDPLLRVTVAGVPASGVRAWVSQLQHRLPRDIVCRAWPVTDAGDADLVLLLSAPTTDGDASHEAEELALRASLASGGCGYQVIASAEAIPQALHAIGRALLPVAPALAQPLLRAERQPRWQGVCEGCSDPDCEYRLFTGLTDQPARADASLQRGAAG